MPEEIQAIDIGMMVQNWLRIGAPSTESVGCTMLDEFPVLKIDDEL